MHTTEIENKTCNMQNKSELALNLSKCTHYSVYLAYDLSSLLGIFEIPSYCYEYHSPTSNNCAVVCAAFSHTHVLLEDSAYIKHSLNLSEVKG